MKHNPKLQSVSLQDLAIIAAFKSKASASIDDPEASMLFKLQSIEIQRMIDNIIQELNADYPTIDKFLPQLVANSTEKLALTAGQLKFQFEKVAGVDSDIMDAHEINEAMTEEVASTIKTNLPVDSPALEYPKRVTGQDFGDFAKAILSKGSHKSKEEIDEEYMNLVKESLIANLKDGNRMEAVTFIKSIFREDKWDDIDAHRFINRFKEEYEVAEPPSKKRQEKLESRQTKRLKGGAVL